MKYIIILALISQLSSPNFEERENSSNILVKMTEVSPECIGPILEEQLKLSQNPPERYHRLKRLVFKYRYFLTSQYIPKNVPVWPCYEFAPIKIFTGVEIPYYLVMLEDINNGGPGVTQYGYDILQESPYYPQSRSITENKIKTIIFNKELSISEVDSYMERMWYFELEYFRKHENQHLGVVESWKKWSKTNNGYPMKE